jgi:hypothetical protein
LFGYHPVQSIIGATETRRGLIFGTFGTFGTADMSNGPGVASRFE